MENKIQEILKSLTQLETSLEQVESAREQVESVVKASGQINTALGNYTQTLGALTDALKEFTAAAQECKKNVVDETDSKLQKFYENISAELEKLKLAQAVPDANGGQTALPEISGRLQEFYDKLCAKVDELKSVQATPVTGEPTPTVPKAEPSNAINEATAAITAQLAELKGKIDALAENIDSNSQSRKINTDTIASLETRLVQMSGINASIEALKAKLDELDTMLPQAFTTNVSANDAVAKTLMEYNDKLTQATHDVMVMRNSTHAILKSMELKLSEHAGKDGKNSLIIAIVALIAFIVILLKLYGVI